MGIRLRSGWIIDAWLVCFYKLPKRRGRKSYRGCTTIGVDPGRARRAEVATEHSDCFVRNELFVILAEERIGLAVKRPARLTYGDFGIAPLRPFARKRPAGASGEDREGPSPGRQPRRVREGDGRR